VRVFVLGVGGVRPSANVCAVGYNATSMFGLGNGSPLLDQPKLRSQIRTDSSGSRPDSIVWKASQYYLVHLAELLTRVVKIARNIRPIKPESIISRDESYATHLAALSMFKQGHSLFMSLSLPSHYDLISCNRLAPDCFSHINTKAGME
jgi:hypothetical protein